MSDEDRGERRPDPQRVERERREKALFAESLRTYLSRLKFYVAHWDKRVDFMDRSD